MPERGENDPAQMFQQIMQQMTGGAQTTDMSPWTVTHATSSRDTDESAHAAISLGDGKAIEAAGDKYGIGEWGDGATDALGGPDTFGATDALGGPDTFGATDALGGPDTFGATDALGGPDTFTYTVSTSAGGAIAGVVIAATTDNNRTSDIDTDIGGFTDPWLFPTETIRPMESLDDGGIIIIGGFPTETIHLFEVLI